MAATKLGLYNAALAIIGEGKLASLSENREPRRLLDDAYGDGSTNKAVRRCLEMSQWSFATRTVQLDYSPSVTPSFGYQYAFDYPTDFVRLCGICSDEFLDAPLTTYKAERAYWYAPFQTIYVSYVSNHSSYGGDLSLWPESFVEAVEAYLATKIAKRLTADEDKVKLAHALWERAKADARSIDAMNKPTAFAPTGSWVRARQGSSC